MNATEKWEIDQDNKQILIKLTETIETDADLETLVLRAASLYRYRAQLFTKKAKLPDNLCPIDYDIKLVLIGDHTNFDDTTIKKLNDLIYLKTIEAYPISSETRQIDGHHWLSYTVMPFFNKAKYEEAQTYNQNKKPLPLCYADEIAFEELLPWPEYYR